MPVSAEAPCESLVVQLAQWRRAWSWRRHAEKQLASLKLTFTQWLVLDATAELIAETGDAVSQLQVATRMDLDKMTLSDAMRVLERLGLVDRGPDIFCRAWRIWVTKKGMDVLEDSRSRVAGVSA